MSRELRRLLIDPGRIEAGGRSLALAPPERRYLERVLRFRPGERLAVVDGLGHLWTARLTPAGGLQLEQEPAAPLQSEGRAAPELELALALPKREVELVWRMACELGADRLQPLQATRCVRSGAPPQERWLSVLREATEQCERLWQPLLLPVAPAEAWLGGGEGGIASGGIGLLATTRRQELPLLEPALKVAAEIRRRNGAPAARISLAIGPEGGWSEAEEQVAEKAGWIPVRLGGSILRTATAAVAGLAALASWRAISSSSSPGPSP
jgi:16S rRNA (uracil1498-N3)-methyltransferase